MRLPRALRLGGHEFGVAYDGREAVALAETFQPEVLFALTGRGQPDDQHRSRAAGFHHHFVKPLDPAEFERVLLERSWPSPSEMSAQPGEATL